MTSNARNPILEKARNLHTDGSIGPAVQLYRQVLSLEPDCADALQLLGTAQMQLGRPDDGVRQQLRALQLNPFLAGVWNNVGLTLRAVGQLEPAVHALRRAMALTPEGAGAVSNLGITVKSNGLQGLVWLRRAIRLQPDNPFHRNELGIAGPAEADRALRQALALAPAYAEAHYHLGLAHHASDPAAAARSYRRALVVNPGFVNAWSNRGGALLDMGDHGGALDCYQRALALDPGHMAALNNMGQGLRKGNRLDRALVFYDRAIRLTPGQPDARYNRGIVRLLLGDLAGGGRDYEVRWQVAGFPSPIRSFSQPLWDGSPLAGRTILLHAEQGLGDTIQFIRFAPLVAARGGRVVVEIPRPLAPLMGTLPGVAQVVVNGDDPLPPFDCHAPLLSLPLLLGTTLEAIPGDVPYLASPPGRRQPVVPGLDTGSDGRCLRVGLVWAGNPTHRNDRNRSIGLDTLAPVLGTAGVRFISLQMGPRRSDLDGPAGAGIVDAAPAITDFADTAAILDHLDLVITVDTSVAHLAGALGRPVWVLLPFAPDWRWLLNRDDSPWYPSMRLFRQTAPGNWSGVVERVRAALGQMAGRHGAAGSSPAGRDDAFVAAIALHQAGQDDGAERAYRTFLARWPDHAAAWSNRGVLLRRLHPDGNNAEACFHRAIALDPCNGQSFYNYGNLLLRLDRWVEAERHYRRAIQVDPMSADLHHNRASALDQAGWDDAMGAARALAAHRRALAIAPDHLDAWGQKAKEHLEWNQLDQALACSARGMALQPGHPVLRYNRALMLLLAGRFEEGWQEYEWRWKADEFPPPMIRPSQPLWRGEPLDGRTLLIHAEQGIGDSFHFLRYLPLAAARAGRVLLAVPEEVAPLIPPSPRVEMLRNGQILPPHDVHCPLLSLPLALGIASPLRAATPYLQADPGRVAAWRQRLRGGMPAGHLSVGLVWAGNPKHANDCRRSMNATHLAGLAGLAGVRFYGLQVGPRAADRTAVGLDGVITDLSPDLTSFAETAAALMALDLVVTVDTSVAHLAGALRRPVWVLLPFAPDWRWQLEREDSPWYPTMRLFRQGTPGDWAGVMVRVRDGLGALAAQRAETEELRGTLTTLAARLNMHTTAGDFVRARAIGRVLAAALPGEADLWHRLDTLAFHGRDLDDAVRCARRCVRLCPDLGSAWTNLGVYHRLLTQSAQALVSQRRAVALMPDAPDTLNNLSNAQGSVGAYAAALVTAARVIRLVPEKADAHYNHAIILKEIGRTAESLDGFRTALRLRPAYPEARFHEALSLLLLGRMDEGWAAYESRWDQPHCREKRRFSVPQWMGEPLEGRTILIHAEQGFGDTFQFLRYVPLLRGKGAGRVLLLVQSELETIAVRMGAADHLIPNGSTLPSFDCHCPLMSLPLAFGTTLSSVPAAVPYLHPDPDRIGRWRRRLDTGAGDGVRVGLVWAGRPTHANDANRSLPLMALAPLARVPGVRWVSLQKGDASVQAGHPPAGMDLLDLSAGLESFEDTAALLSSLDLVITVDTSVAHLAGALGRPVWVLLPFHPDWRWMLDRDDCPWYPTARLFRQRRRGDWTDTILRLVAALRQEYAGDSPEQTINNGAVRGVEEDAA